MSDNEFVPDSGNSNQQDKEGSFFEEDDLRLSSHLLRILKEMMDAYDKPQNGADYGDSPISTSTGIVGEDTYGQFLVIIDKLRTLKNKASKAIAKNSQELREKWSFESVETPSTESGNVYLVDLINQIAEAVARADGYLPHNITVGKGGSMHSSESSPLPFDLGVSSTPSPSASTIIIKLCRGTKQETSDAIKTVLAIYNNSIATNREVGEELGRISVLDLRKAGGLNLLLNAFKRCQQQHWPDLEMQICKGVSFVLTFEDEDPQLLLRNVWDILNVLLFTLSADPPRDRHSSRSRTNSLIAVEVSDKGWRRDELGKAVLSRQSTVSINSGSVSSSDPEQSDELQRGIVAKALSRLCVVLSSECGKLDQSIPLMPTTSDNAINFSLGRVLSSTAPSLVRSDSVDSVSSIRPTSIDRSSSSAGGRRRSLSGATKDNGMADASKSLQLIVKIIQMLCDDNSNAIEGTRSPFASYDDDTSLNRYPLSPLISPQISPRGGLTFDDIKVSESELSALSSIDPTIALCCTALCTLTEVPIFVPALVDNRALVLFKGWMDLCSHTIRYNRCRALPDNGNSWDEKLVAVFTDQVCTGLVNMLGSPTTAAMPNADHIEGAGGRAPVAWMDMQILRTGLVKSIVGLIQSTVTDFALSLAKAPPILLSRTTERSLGHFLHQLCSRHAYQRKEMFSEKTPYAFAALFVNAANRCKSSKDTVDLEYLDYITWTCLDGLTYFLTDMGSGQIEDRDIDEMVNFLSCSSFIEAITYSLANLTQSKARLASLYVVSNLTEWPNTLQALVEGGVVEPLVVIAQSHMRQKDTMSELQPPKLFRQHGADKYVTPSVNMDAAAVESMNVTRALSSFDITSITTLAEYATRDRLSSSLEWFARSPTSDPNDDIIRSAKAAARRPHTFSSQGENPAIKIGGLYFTAANSIEESMTVCSSLANVSQFSLEYAARLYKSGLLEIMLKVIENDNPEVKRQALRCVGAICAIIPSRSTFGASITDQEFPETYGNVVPTHVPREIFYGNESPLHLEAARVRKLVSAFDRDPENTSMAFKVLTDALSSDNSFLQKEAMNGLAGLALSEDDAMKDQIFVGPLKLACTLMMDTNHDEDIRTAAEKILVNTGFMGGRDDFQMCSHDFSILKDWFNMRRWMEPQRLCYILLAKWVNHLFPNSESGRQSPATNNRPVPVSGVSTTPPRGIDSNNPTSLSRARSLSPSGFNSRNSNLSSPSDAPKDGTMLNQKSLTESLAEMVGLPLNRQSPLDDAADTSITPWTLGPRIHYDNHVRNSISEGMPDLPPFSAMAAQNMFFPSRIHKLFLMDLMTLGCDEDSNQAEFGKVGYDSDGSVGTSMIGSSGLAVKKNEKPFGPRVYLPNIHEVYAIGMPALNYHHINITSLARVIEKTISECSAHNPDRLFALAFANSTFAEDSHVPFLACLHRVTQITALTFRENKSSYSGFAFTSSPRQTKDSLDYLAGHVPSSIRFLTFQGCLVGKQVQWLCGQLKRNNAAFKGHAENLHSMNNGDDDDYDSDTSTTSYSTNHSGKDASSTKDRSRNGKETKGHNALRWKYTKGIIGLALTNITFGNDEVKQICKLLNPRGLIVNRDSMVSNSYHRGVAGVDDDKYIASTSNNDGRGLKYLDLSDNKMTDEQCAKILDAASCGPLEGLDLAGNIPKLCTFLLESLSRIMQINDPTLSKLRHLGLHNIGLTTQCFCTVLDLMSPNSTLTSLDLSNNNCGDSLDLGRTIMDFFDRNKTLRHLNLSHNSFDIDTLKALEFGLMENLTLILLPFVGNNTDISVMREIQQSLARNRRYYSKAANAHQDRTASWIVKKERSRRNAAGSGMTSLRQEAVDEEVDEDSGTASHIEVGIDAKSILHDATAHDENSPTFQKSIGSPSTHADLALSVLSDTKPGVAGQPRSLTVDKKQIDKALSGQKLGLPIDSLRVGVRDVPHQPDTSYFGSGKNASKYTTFVWNSASSSPRDSLVISTKGSDFGIGLGMQTNSPEISRQNSFATPANNTLCVFFAAPLVLRERGGTLYPAGKPLPYNVERDAIIQVFKEVHRDNNVSFGFATTDTVRSAVTMGCRALHISGHGHPDFIWFEDGLAGLQMVSKDALRNLLSAGNVSIPDFVFISACHSESTAAAFVELGVKHVVCVKVDMQIQDSLAVVFTRAFYLALLSGNTVKQSFDIGKEAVSTSPYVRGGSQGPQIESSKFILLPIDGSHEEAIFNGKRTSKWPSKPYHCVHGFAGVDTSNGRNTTLSMTSPGSKYVPAPPVDFIGREVDTYRIIRDIVRQRFVTLTGVLGVGKTSLACAACTYMADRRLALLEDGVLFLKAKGISSYDSFLEAMRELLFDRNMLSSNLRDRVKKLMQQEEDSASDEDEDVTGFLNSSTARTEARDKAEHMSHSRLEKLILSFFVPLRMLLVLDHIDDMIDVDDLKVFLASLFHECPAVKVLVVCTQTLRMLRLPNHGVTETTCGLDNLTLKNTLRLFARMSPLLKTLQDKETFVKHILGKQDAVNPQHSLTIMSRGITTKSIGIFRALGNGHPATIIKLAHESTDAKFCELVRLAADTTAAAAAAAITTVTTATAATTITTNRDL